MPFESLLLKGGFLIILFFYILFAFIIFNQVRVMNRIVHAPPVSSIILFLALLHIVISLSLFLIALGIL